VKDELRLAQGAECVRQRAAWLMAWLTAWLVAGLAVPMPALGATAQYSIGPAPAWVVPVAPGVASAGQAGQNSEGEIYLLSDTQSLADDAQRVTYHRVVSTAVNASGVDAVANIDIPFDPSYQSLVLHAINIVRHGRVIPKLATARIQVIQRETELEARIYDGTKTVNVFLDDVRPGDTVDYSYSRIGRNRVFKGIDFGTVLLQFGTPVARIHVRLLVPQSKSIKFAAANTTLKPVVREHDGRRDYLWDVRDVPGQTVEEGAPDWYAPYAQIAWSEFADWAAVARWAQPLYQVPESLSPALQAQVDRIAKSQTAPAARMLAALQLVQGEVRYLGVEIGPNSQAPNAPALVYARRFGDCKDKTLLTLTLLKHLGIDARAALVNTDLQRGLADALPAPGMFDHVLVQARVDGKVWWLDPTRFTQKADLDHLFQPDYGPALIVDPATQGLTPMRHADPASARRSLSVTFDASAGFDKPVRYTVQTTTTGEPAEALRATLSTTSLAQVQKNYMNFYAGDYPHITAAAPLRVRDDEPDNRIVTTETYAIANIATPSDDGKGHEVDIHLPDIVQLLNDPVATVRKSPLLLTYPQDVSQQTVVLLPEDWPIKPVSTIIDDPAFRFEQTVKLDGLHLIITDHYQALSEEVSAKDMPRYVGDLARARSIAGYELTWSDVAATPTPVATAKATGLDRMNWPLALLAAGMLGCSAWLAAVAYRYDPSPRGTADPRWVGIRGWLMVLAVVVAIKPLMFIGALKYLAGVMAIDRWSQLTTYGAAGYNALWAPLLLFELAADIVQPVLWLMLLPLFLQRRSSVPRLIMLMLLAGVVLHMTNMVLVGLVHGKPATSDQIWQVVGSVIGTAFWSAYLLQSRRVKATFTQRYRLRVPPPLPRTVDRVVAVEPSQG